MDDIWAQSQTVDPEVRAYVYSLVNAIGGSSTLDGRYELGDDALHALRDLRRWLQLYDEKTGRFDVKRCLAEANVVKGDLLEILALWDERKQDSKVFEKLALSVLELLVPLTWPLELEDEKTTINNHRHTPYLQLAQVDYKRATLGHEWAQILRAVVRVGLPAMTQPRRERSRRDEGILKLVLYFILNIAMITQPQYLPSQGDENDVSRSSTIDAFHLQDVFSLILTLGSGTGDEFVEQDVILLEILFHLLKGVDARQLFFTDDHVKQQQTDELKACLQKEKAMRAGYAKQAPTRHNKFGTMIWVRRNDEKLSTVSGQNTVQDASSTLRQMDASKKWNRPRYRGKLAQHFSDTDFSKRVELNKSARTHLKSFVEDFLDSSFNPVFSSLRKAIAGEADRIQRSDFRNHEVMFFYLVSWFLCASRARRSVSSAHHNSRTDRPIQEQQGDSTFVYIAAVLDQETFILLNRVMQRALDEKEYTTLQATLQCFTQILLAVQDMAESENEDDQEIADNIQNRIFYEESTHDRVISVLRHAEKLGLTYLDTVTECIHVFIRMLERYSKQNVDLQIRSKRRAKRKMPDQDKHTASNDVEADAEEIHRAELVTKERKFDFAKFTNKFMTQSCVNTWILFLQFYKDLHPAQLKRIHRFLYRLAFKNDMAIYLFRVDILRLFHRLIKGPDALDPESEGFNDWQQLVQQVFRRCIKWITRASAGENVGDDWEGLALTEMLFSKVPNTVFYLRNGYERVVEKRPPRRPAELEIKPSVEGLEARIGVALSLMLEQGEAHLLNWIKAELDRAMEERTSWEAAGRARSEAQNDDIIPDQHAESEMTSGPAITLSPTSTEQKDALFKDKYLRLMLKTLGFQSLDLAEGKDITWIVPPELTAADLLERRALLQRLEFDPPTYEEGQRPGDMVRSVASARRTKASEIGSEDDGSGSDDGVDKPLFPPNEREKRKNHGDDEDRPKKRRKLRNTAELTEEELMERARERKLREREKSAKIKSALRVTESDDETDEEADAAFFKLEDARRRRMAGAIRKALADETDAANLDSDTSLDGDSGGNGMGRRNGTRRNPIPFSEESASDSEASVDGDPVHAVARDVGKVTSHLPDAERSEMSSGSGDRHDDTDSISAEDDGETPSTSPTAAVEKVVADMPLKQVSGNIATMTRDDGSDGDDDGLMVKVPGRRRRRAGFIIDDDSDSP